MELIFDVRDAKVYRRVLRQRIRLSLALVMVCPLIGNGVAFAQQNAPFLRKREVLLFQGDSITNGGRQRTGSDYNHIMGQDYAYILAATLGARFPDRGLVFLNRGIGGSTVADMETRWQEDVLDEKPTLLSILIGINDTTHAVDKDISVERYESIYEHLLSTTVEVLPSTRIVLGEPFMLPVGRHKATYDAEMIELRKRQAIVHKLANKYHLPVISYQAAFDSACKRAPADHWSWDGIHPTYAGHGLMAELWLETLSAFWPKE